MRKLAIFVEGQTEQLFIKRLIEEVAGKKNLTIQLDRLQGGAQSPRAAINEIIVKSQEETKYYVLIRDSSSDSRVVSDVKDNIYNLQKEGFEKVIGLRDLYPIALDELKDVEGASNYVIPKNSIDFNIVIAVREIETWFLAEINHYEKIHNALNLGEIKNKLNIDLASINTEIIEHPSSMLHEIYNLVGFAYKKSRKHVERTVNALDMENTYLNLSENMKSLMILIGEIDDFLVE
ncbi:DUF4276 family protein [Aeromonas sp. R7-2]|uniref:DUF4276 family protein n=1 Tax=Aeromonas sp. R7-2 TaxID=3138474 RepID=UPI0034A444FE